MDVTSTNDGLPALADLSAARQPVRQVTQDPRFEQLMEAALARLERQRAGAPCRCDAPVRGKNGTASCGALLVDDMCPERQRHVDLTDGGA